MKMGLLRTVDNVPGVDLYDYRDTLYYNKYEYRLRLNIPCSRYTYYCKKPEDLDKKLSGTSKSSWSNVKKDDIPTVTKHLSALKEIVKITTERKAKSNYSVRLEGNTIAIFTGDLQTLQDLEKRIGSEYRIDCTKSQTAPFVGVKYFVKKPKHKYRVYLKSKRVEDGFHGELGNTFKTQTKLYPSPALKAWVNSNSKMYGMWYFRWTSAGHFIDYDDESILSYLSIMHGEILGKKYKLEKRPDNI